jgi:hypothetical protein
LVECISALLVSVKKISILNRLLKRALSYFSQLRLHFRAITIYAKHYKNIKFKNEDIPLNEIKPRHTKLTKMKENLKKGISLGDISGFRRSLRSSLFLNVTRSRLVVDYRRFSKTYRSSRQESSAFFELRNVI